MLFSFMNLSARSTEFAETSKPLHLKPFFFKKRRFAIVPKPISSALPLKFFFIFSSLPVSLK